MPGPILPRVGTLGLQDANAVDIDGGTIDGTPIGATTPAAAAFTTLSANSGSAIPDLNTSDLKFAASGHAINKWTFYNNPGGFVSYGIGMSAATGFDLISGNLGFAFLTGCTNVDGTGAVERVTIANSGAMAVLVSLAVGSQAAKVGGVIFNHSTDTSSTSVDGTEDDLYSNTTAASTLSADNQSINQIEHVQFVSSATATRRLKKYFAGTLIFDSAALTLSLGGDFILETTIIRESSTVVRCTVSVVTTSASSVPYATYTRITGLTLSGTNILKTTGIAAGVGAAAADIKDKHEKTFWYPAA